MADVQDMNTTKASDLQAWIPEVGPKKKKGKRKPIKTKKSKRFKALKDVIKQYHKGEK